jgi:vitamin B12 transporter
LDSSTISSSNQFTPAWLSRLSYSQSRDVNRTDNQTAFPYQDRYVTRNRVVSWVNSVTLAPKWLLTVGAEQQRQSVDTDDGFGDLYAKTRTVKALFAGVQGTGGPHGLQLNLRRDDVAELGAKSTAYVGYGYLLGSGFKLIASWSSAFSAPPLGYLYAPYFGNPDLKPELARSAELGVQWTGPGQQVRSTLFTTRTRDQLSYDFDTSRFENLARTRNQGLETSYTGTVAQTHINASLTLQHPTDDITGQRLRRRATTLASVSANRAFGSWQVGASLRYASGRPDGANALAAYTLADLTARYAVAKGLEVTARVENLFDRVYQTAYGYNQPPRGVFAGLVWSPAR